MYILPVQVPSSNVVLKSMAPTLLLDTSTRRRHQSSGAGVAGKFEILVFAAHGSKKSAMAPEGFVFKPEVVISLTAPVFSSDPS